MGDDPGAVRSVAGHEVRGVDLGPETRCAHYESARDVIAVRVACCGVYYSCFRCHDALADHERDVWSRSDFDARAVLCGVCGAQLRVRAYLDAEDACPRCGADFNPGCRDHYRYYFETNDG